MTLLSATPSHPLAARAGRAARFACLPAVLALAAWSATQAPARQVGATVPTEAIAAIPTARCTINEDHLASWSAVTRGLGRSTTRLRADGLTAAPDIMTAVLDLGQIQVRSAKPTASITRVGIPNKLPERWTQPTGDAEKDREQRERNRANGNGYFEGPIDLRFRFSEWAHAFAVEPLDARDCPQRSLVFFNAQGRPVHSVTLANTTHIQAYERLVAEFRHAAQTVPALAAATPPAAPQVADSDVDLAAYHQAWLAITDVHQFNRVMRDFRLGREQALRLAPPGKARLLAPDAMQQLLKGAAAQGVETMVFVSNGAVTQVFGDRLHHVRRDGDWLIVDDPTAHIALNAAAVASAWQIERAGIHSVDFYDGDAQLIASFFGVRSQAQPVPHDWIALVQGIASAQPAP